jgi:hypothetical protein
MKSQYILAVVLTLACGSAGAATAAFTPPSQSTSSVATHDENSSQVRRKTVIRTGPGMGVRRTTIVRGPLGVTRKTVVRTPLGGVRRTTVVRGPFGRVKARTVIRR